MDGLERFSPQLGSLPPEHWAQIQESFSQLTGLPIRLLEAKGAGEFRWTEPAVPPSRENLLCRLLTARSPERGGCHQYCGKAPQHAFRKQASVLYKCHAQLLSFAVPVVLGPEKGWVLLGGHAFMNQADFSRFLDEAPGLGLAPEEVVEVSRQVGIVDVKRVRSAVQFVEHAMGELLRGAGQNQRYRTRLSQVESLYEISGELGVEPYERYGLVLNTLGVLFDVNTASVMVLDPQGACYRTQLAFGERELEVAGYSCPVQEGLAARVQAERRPVQIREVSDLLRLGLPNQVVTAVWAFPLWWPAHMAGVREGLLGLLNIFNTDLKPDVVRFITGFCQQVAQAVAMGTLREEVRRQVQEQETLMEINRVIAGTTGSEQLCRVIMEKSSELLKAEKGSLMLYDETHQELAVKAAKGLHERLGERFRIKPGEGIAGAVFQSGEPMVVRDIELNTRLQRKNRPRYRTKSFICLPLRVDGRVIGVLNLSDKVSGEGFYEGDLQRLLSIAVTAMVALERSQLSERSKELLHISITDPLTALLNRRSFDERLTEEIDRSRRHGHEVSLLLIDIDDFKPYNDTHGHLAGDEALRTVGGCIRAAVRNFDVLARIGGDEFAVILPATQKEGARMIAERLRAEIERAYIPYEETQPVGRLTVSVGLGSFPADSSSLTELINNTDRALYAAKAAGKNCTMLYS